MSVRPAAGAGRRRRRWLVALVAIVGAITLPAPAAHADPARPGDVWSKVAGIDPPDTPVTVKVSGGDAFLQLTAARGHEVTVFDYDTPPQPYLRFMADGLVQENVHSRAHFQNASRYASDFGPTVLGAPEWHTVAHDGTYAWHDHRIHFMARIRPEVSPWQVVLSVDGHTATVNGFWGPADAPSPLPWLVLALGAGLWAAVAMLLSVRVGAAVAACAALAALPVALALGRLPAAGGLVRTGGLVVAALGLALAALLARARPVATALLAGSGIALALWSLRRFGVLSHAVLVTALPPWWDRAAVALALGIGLAVLATAVRQLLSSTAPTTRPTDAPAAATDPTLGGQAP